MRVFAYCGRDFQQSVTKAAGVVPLLSPPTMMSTFFPGWLEGHDFIYFKLHGWDISQPYWYGDDWQTAISAAQIRQANLGGATVFVANCFLTGSPMYYAENYLALTGSPIYHALRAANAGPIIGGPGENFAASNRVVGADMLGMWVRRFMQIGLGVSTAFALARGRLHMVVRPGIETTDALGFGLHKTRKG